MATVTERSPGVWFARTYLAPSTPAERGRQVGKVLRGSKKAVRARVAEWEAEIQGTAPTTVGSR